MKLWEQYILEDTPEVIKAFYKGARESDPEFAKNYMKSGKLQRILFYKRALLSLEKERMKISMHDGGKEMDILLKHIDERIAKQKQLLANTLKKFAKRGAIGLGAAAIVGGAYGANKLYQKRKNKEKD
jgi:hypothetical protein